MMPKITRSIAEVDAVREQILSCAFEILVKNGYESLSMAKIGSRMKMTAANLYNYYANKDELLITIHKKAYALLYDKIREATKSAQTPLERYKNMAHAFVEFGTGNINIYDIMFNRPIRQYSDYIGTPQEELAYKEFHSSLKPLSFAVKIIQEYRKTRPNLKPANPKFLAIQSISALHGIISLYNSRVLHQIVDDPELMMKSIIDNVLHSITE
jgi:AcrR family transcriptional regulator